ncbi:Uncharacterised protein [Candidatus Anstonella stagnisolia]|nr:Uncharacterised protein [Candidatus Anstonella stagnisolia]
MAKKGTAKKGMSLLEKEGMAVGLAGVLFFLFGLLLLITPTMTINSTIFVLGLLLVVAGLLKLYEGLFKCKGTGFAGYLVIMGLIAIIAGGIMLAIPDAVTAGVILTFGFLALILAVIAIIGGLGQIAYALKKLKSRIVPLIVGILFVLLGLFMLFNPLSAGLALVSIIGLFVIMYGVLLMVFSLYLGSLV